MGYYIDQMVEKDRKMRLADLFGGMGGSTEDFTVNQPAPQQMPQNFLRNQDTGATYDFGPSQQAGPALDYSSPIEIGGYGKGYRIKGDPMTAVLSDGRIVRMGADTGADRKRMMEDIALQKAQQGLAEGQTDHQLKQMQLAELMGVDPTQMGGMPQFPAPPTGTPGFFPENGGQPSGAQQQGAILNQRMLERRFGKAPAGHRWDAQGGAVPIPGIEKPLTEFQGKSSGYGARAAVAHETLNAVGEDGKVQPGLIKRAAEALPGLGFDLNQSLATGLNWTQSPQQQQVEQSQRDFVNAVLRQESGAAISDDEFDNARKQYFPQPGDGPEVILQKKRNREQAISGFATSAGDTGRKQITAAREKTQAIFEAHKAIKQGKDKEAVKQRLEAYGITDHGIK